MRVLFVSQSFAPDPGSGAERVCADIAHGLALRGHAVDVLSLGDTGTAQRDGNLTVHRLAFAQSPRPGPGPLPLTRRRKLLWHVRNAHGGVSAEALDRLVAGLRPDVVCAHNASAFLPQLFRVCATRSLPLALHLHDYGLICPRTTMYRKGLNCASPCAGCRLLTAPWRRAAGAVGHVIAVSDFVARRYREQGLFPHASWSVVHNQDRGPLADFTPKTSGPFAFGFVGALTEVKGLPDLLAAFERLPKARANLVVAGRGEPALEARLALSDDVTWLGRVPPNRAYGRMDCLVLPSRWHEPQALVLTEGLRRGLRIIASDRGGNTEILRGRPPHLLYDPDVPGALARAMTAALADGPMRADPRGPAADPIDRVEAILASMLAGVPHA
ncbi:glycosyltransferase [Histidinibacterium lentulum]|uniref:Glycosyltransferase n=1 Tax=Histidinibacterium lentulum TaxID=2480588 RepID=A0A3N2QS55_9RHOB|nr:glycosyltransferase [Histidinibacterium lentulum]ROT98043.1 glycosyltransferase [Histidinibacterium lentulum]